MAIITGIIHKECAINARSPESEADEFEKKQMEELDLPPRTDSVSVLDFSYGITSYKLLRNHKPLMNHILNMAPVPIINFMKALLKATISCS